MKHDFPALLADLESPDWKVRCNAAQALGLTRHRPAVEPLIEHLRADKSWTVRSRAAVALGRIKDPRAIEPLLEAGCVKHAMGAVMKFGVAAVPALAAILADTTQPFSTRAVMAKMIGDIGGEAARSALIAAAWDEEVSVRWSVAEALGRSGPSEESFTALLFLLRDPVPMIGAAAAQSLGALRDERAIESLVGMFQGDQTFGPEFDPLVSATHVLRVWAGVRGKAFHEIAPRLRDEEPLARIAAALSLAWLRDERGLEPLREATNDADPLVRHAATWALGALEKALSYNVPIPPLVISFLLR